MSSLFSSDDLSDEPLPPSDRSSPELDVSFGVDLNSYTSSSSLAVAADVAEALLVADKRLLLLLLPNEDEVVVVVVVVVVPEPVVAFVPGVNAAVDVSSLSS